ncbi:hypothetical protein PI126_g17083 [Phytophthora idaei]|nr:hypothetical protein PI126_g17083 [Phytophthora idaei]
MLNTFRRLHDVHGNERIGVKVLDVLRLALLGAAPLSTANNLFPRITRGSVTLVYGNPRAQRIDKRGSEPHADLNRCFPRNLLEIPESKLDPSYEHHRAKKLAPLSTLPSQLMEISGRLPTKMLLLDPKHLIGDGNVALTDEFVGVHGGMGICYESGLANPQQRKCDGERGSRCCGCVYGVGEENFQRIPAGKPIGFVGSEPFTVNYDSHVVFPKIPALWKVDAPLGWLTRRMSA